MARILYRLGSLLLLSALLFLAGLTLYLKQRPEELAALLARAIEAQSGFVCTMRSVGVTLLPKPMLALVDVDVRGGDLALSSPYVTIWPRLAPLLRGEFRPGEIFLARVSLAYASLPELTFSDARLELPERSGNGIDAPITVDALELRLADAVFKLAGVLEHASQAPVFSGRLEFAAFSLPRYFAFARSLPSGIQHSLDRLSGHMDFKLDARSLDVPHLRCATSHGAIFTGKGSVQDFAKPKIALDLQSGAVNLDKEFPEILRIGVAPPEYGHEPLVGVPAPSGHAALPGIGYDIRIRAAQALVASSQAQGLALRCSPGTQGPRLAFHADALFGGRVQGSLALSGEEGAPLRYALKLKVRNLDLKRMQKLLPANTHVEGSISGNADLRFAGDSTAARLSRLGGAFSLRLDQGFHTVTNAGKEERVAFPLRALSGTFQGQGMQGERLNYTGKWQVEAQDGDWRVDAQLDGPLNIALEGLFPLRLTRVPGVVQVRRTTAWKGWLPQGLHMECSGKFSLDSEQSGVAVEEAGARLFDCELTGQLRGKYAKEGLEAQGRLGVKGASLRRTLAKLGMKDPGMNSALLQAFSGVAAVNLSPGKLALSEMEGRIDGNRFSGSVEGQWGQRPLWQGNVQLDALDLQAYLDTGPQGQKAKPWNLAFLQDFDAKGLVEVQRLRALGMGFRQTRADLRLTGGVLEFSPVTAELYGGLVTARVRLNTREGPGIQANVQANRLDLRAFSDERRMDALYEGKASIQLALAGLARSGADFPAGLNGRFFLETGSGSMQARKHLQQQGASPTRFDRIVIAGPVERGVFRSERFQLDGPALNATGGGWVSMPEETLDLKLEVRRPGLPAFPVHIYGKLDKPQTSVKAGQALVKAVGRLGKGVADGVETVGSGLLDVLGSVLSAPLKLLK